MTKTVAVINGVSIATALLGIVHARKYAEKDGRWTLATKRGIVIAVFVSEAALDSWWQVFQTGQGRQPRRLIEGKAPEPSKASGRKDGSIFEAGRDYLKPWSKDYNMPEYDLE